MIQEYFKVLSINASRIRNLGRIRELYAFIMLLDAEVVFIQEIYIAGALQVFSPHFQVYVNMEPRAYDTDGVGIVTIIKHEIKVLENIIGSEGRILGLKIANVQLWHVYPISGSGFKKEREIFFRETLNNYMMLWKDSTKYVIQGGDHNATHRLVDSVNNQREKFQDGLVKHLTVHGLKDDFLSVHGENEICYSRITARSKTRIDYIFSNTKKCMEFEYIETQLNFDHKACLAKYDIELVYQKEFLPRERFYKSWVIPKNLEFDQEFLNCVKFVLERTEEEIMQLDWEKVDFSYFWGRSKLAIKKIAKERQAVIVKEVNEQLNVLNIFYLGTLEKIKDGVDAFEELESIKSKLNVIYKARAEQAVDKLKGTLIDDHVYDIHKLQNQRRFENEGRIKQIKVGENIYTGTVDVVEAIAGVMRDELKVGCDEPFENPETPEEAVFLEKLRKVGLSREEKMELIAPVSEEEIGIILNNEVDKDSSPGEDGITYRFMKCFWDMPSYRFLYVNYLNYIREIGNFGLESNNGIMVVKNKKTNTIEYKKKRKLTKVNKDSNLGLGKVWTKRLKKLVLPKVLPKTQFNCQDEVNIIDELRELRNLNQFLLGDETHGQINGTILSIDFDNAYRSTYLRWFNLVMKALGLPQEFVDWFWTMYKDLSVTIVVNSFKSLPIKVERGFMEGSPPSMAAFVLCLAPLMVSLEEVLEGIQTGDDINHKVKAFADDMKLCLADPKEIPVVYDLICKFEAVSGMKMHRDPRREKCQALPFGTHRDIQDWPEWVTVKDAIKVVGAWFSNIGNLEKLNGDLVKKVFFDTLHKSWGIRGTIQQKVYFVNTYLFSKVWYISQIFDLDKKLFYGSGREKGILTQALKFIWAGENERCTRPLQFRSKDKGGLGLIEPYVKAKAFLVKNMVKDFKQYEFNHWFLENIYGDQQIMLEIMNQGKAEAQVKEIYQILLDKVVINNGSIIPSREERRSQVKWKRSWKNQSNLRGVVPEEKMFAWKLCQDLLPVGARIHRANAERRCLAILDMGTTCLEVQDREHFFRVCELKGQIYRRLEMVLGKFLGKDVSFVEVIHLSFSHRNERKLRIAVWFAVKWLYKMWISKNDNRLQLMMEMLKEIDWNVKMKRFSRSHGELSELREIVDTMKNT